MPLDRRRYCEAHARDAGWRESRVALVLVLGLVALAGVPLAVGEISNWLGLAFLVAGLIPIAAARSGIAELGRREG
jgi:hypothetical protein